MQADNWEGLFSEGFLDLKFRELTSRKSPFKTFAMKDILLVGNAMEIRDITADTNT